ncbi:MAG: hypothetical protein ACD_24C00293G0001 [uncultured bacterium]|nr:MAG: hypothetical protein ACD_24C00293G0001 [uncultured bacterium]
MFPESAFTSKLLYIFETLFTFTLLLFEKLAVSELTEPDPLPLIKADRENPPDSLFTWLMLTFWLTIAPCTLTFPVWILTFPEFSLALLFPV